MPHPWLRAYLTGSTDDDLGPLRESARSPFQEKCASKCVRSIVLSAFIYFLAQMDLRLEIFRVRFEI